MCLVWSKKTSNVPIRVTSAHRPQGGPPPNHVSTCVLDIDITKNVPRIVEHKKSPNSIKQWIGTELEIVIMGNWTTYKSRITQYLQQLAIITPYAQLELVYENLAEPQRNMSIRYDRRSEQMPPAAREVKHHPRYHSFPSHLCNRCEFSQAVFSCILQLCQQLGDTAIVGENKAEIDFEIP